MPTSEETLIRKARRTIFLLADAHLGAQGGPSAQDEHSRLFSFFDYLRMQPDAQLIICGDLFDFWFEYRHVVPAQHYRVLAQLANLVASGIEVDYIAGNHDFWLGSFLARDVGITIHRDDMELTQAGKRIYLRHGDGLMKKDRLYRAMKAVLRNRLAVILYRLLHPDLGIPVALFFSHLSRESARNKAHTDRDYRHYAYDRLDAGYDIVVLGHSHIAALERRENGVYLNPGYWRCHFTFARIDDGTPHLLRWDGSQAHPCVSNGVDTMIASIFQVNTRE